jgi:hypothetical protein
MARIGLKPKTRVVGNRHRAEGSEWTQHPFAFGGDQVFYGASRTRKDVYLSTFDKARGSLSCLPLAVSRW